MLWIFRCAQSYPCTETYFKGSIWTSVLLPSWNWSMSCAYEALTEFLCYHGIGKSIHRSFHPHEVVHLILTLCWPFFGRSTHLIDLTLKVMKREGITLTGAQLGSLSQLLSRLTENTGLLAWDLTATFFSALRGMRKAEMVPSWLSWDLSAPLASSAIEICLEQSSWVHVFNILCLWFFSENQLQNLVRQI